MSPATLHDVSNISTNPSTVLSRSILMGEEGGAGHSGPKSWCTVPKLNRSMKMDKSMSKIMTKLL